MLPVRESLSWWRFLGVISTTFAERHWPCLKSFPGWFASWERKFKKKKTKHHTRSHLVLNPKNSNVQIQFSETKILICIHSINCRLVFTTYHLMNFDLATQVFYKPMLPHAQYFWTAWKPNWNQEQDCSESTIAPATIYCKQNWNLRINVL